LVKRVKFGLSFTYFLGIDPESDVINPSILIKCRKSSLTDGQLPNLLIFKTVEIVLENNVISNRDLIIDSTHTRSKNYLQN